MPKEIIEETKKMTKEQADIKELILKLEEQARTIDILKDAVNKNKLEKSIKDHDTTSKYPTGYFKRLRGNLIVKWLGADDIGSQVKQEIVYQNNIPLGERMVGHYLTLDNDSIVCDMLEFIRSNSRESFDIIKQDGDKLVIRFHNLELPQEYETNIKFINP